MLFKQDLILGVRNLYIVRIVFHECRQQYDVLRQLVAAPGFAERVNDIVVEFGNARYQNVVDRYIAGENVPLEQVQRAWRDPVGALGPVSDLLFGGFPGQPCVALLHAPASQHDSRHSFWYLGFNLRGHEWRLNRCNDLRHGHDSIHHFSLLRFRFRRSWLLP